MARGKHEGSISKRADGRWEAKLTLPGGKRKSFYGKTRKEVADRLRVAQHDQAQGLPIVGEKQTVTQYLDSWLATVALIIDPSTHRRYSEFVTRYFPPIGGLRLAHLNAQHVQALYNELAGRLAASTVRHAHAILHHALKDAVRLGLVQRNVSELVTLPRRTTHEMRPFTEAEAQRFLATCVGERLEALYILALTTGMRLGELLALHWQDIDLERSEVHVRLAVQEVTINGRRGFTLAEPKTKHSLRTIALSNLAVQALYEHLARQRQERQMIGPDWEDQGFVFPDVYGDMMRYRTPYSRFKKLLKKGSLPERRFHDLRHTFATILLSHGVYVKLVSEALGHADIAMTLGIYGHVLPHMHEAVANMIDTILLLEGPKADE